MHKPRLITSDMLGQMGQKSNHVMFGNSFYFVDTCDVKRDVFGFPNRLGVGPRNHPEVGLSITGMGLDLVPDAEFGLGRPDGNHVGTGIARDHATDLLL